jgi:hypothetical protein
VARRILAALVLAHAGLVLGLVLKNTVVFDEFAHVPSGVYHWRTGSFAAYSVNPPLSRLLAALPLLPARPSLDLSDVGDDPTSRPEWPLGARFAEGNAKDYRWLIRLARLPGIAWSALGAIVIFCWAREVHGDARAGLLGAGMWCFEPTIMGFAAVVTPDIPATVAGTAATYMFWRTLRNPLRRGALAAGLLLGVAELTKFTLLALYLAWPLMWLFRRRSARWGDRRVGEMGAGHFLVIALSSLLVINLGYGFKGTFRPRANARVSQILVLQGFAI